MALTEYYLDSSHTNNGDGDGTADQAGAGGAFNSWSNAHTTLNGTNGWRLNCSNGGGGAESVGSVNWVANASDTAPVIFRGCTSLSTPADGGMYELTGTAAQILYSSGDQNRFENIGATSSGTVAGNVQGGAHLHNVRVTSTRSSSALCLLLQGSATDCLFEITNASNPGIVVNIQSRVSLLNCRLATVGAGKGIELTGFEALEVVGCVIEGAGSSAGIEASLTSAYAFHVVGCTIHNWSDGILVTALPASLATNYAKAIINCVIYNVDDGIENDDTDTCGIHIWNNAIGDATNRYSGWGDYQDVIDAINAQAVNHDGDSVDLDLTASPFTDTTDYALNDTSGGGAECRGAAIQVDSDFDGTPDGSLDIGAVQTES